METKRCECGCGAEVKRRFKPGHDGRLKGRLLSEARSTQWWVRERAVLAMIDRGWGHFLPMEIIAMVPVRSRHHGRFVETRHIDSLFGVVCDEKNHAHSHWSCPEQTGRGSWTNIEDNTGWLCGVCIHLHDMTEQVGMRLLFDPAVAGRVEDEDLDTLPLAA
jgi:hypothetical protein